MSKDTDKVDKDCQRKEKLRKEVEELKHSWDEFKLAFRPVRGVLIVLAVIGIVWMLMPSVSEEERYCGGNIHAENASYAAAIVFVELRLRDPESAIHPPEPISVSWLGGCDHLVTGSLRARNGFGGYSQHIYVVQTHYDLAKSQPSARLVSFE